jgi:hypothetical protein
MIFDPTFWSLLLTVLFLAPVFGNVIGCCCAGEADCEICADDFTRDNDTDIDTGSPCGWTEVSGAWAISSNSLVCTSAGLAVCTAPHPTETRMTVEVDFSKSANTSHTDVVVGYTDSNNYFYVRYTTGAGSSGTITIVRVIGGAHDSVGSVGSLTIDASTTYTAKVCLADHGITAYLDGEPLLTRGIGGSPEGQQAGLQASGTGTATFNNFFFTRGRSALEPYCPQCGYGASSEPCPACDPIDSQDAQYKVTISGMTDSAGSGCDDCDSVNGIHFLNLTAIASDGQDPPSGLCEWMAPFGPLGCTGNPENCLLLQLQTGGTVALGLTNIGPCTVDRGSFSPAFVESDNPNLRDCDFSGYIVDGEAGNHNNLYPGPYCNSIFATAVIDAV